MRRSLRVTKKKGSEAWRSIKKTSPKERANNVDEESENEHVVPVKNPVIYSHVLQTYDLGMPLN